MGWHVRTLRLVGPIQLANEGSLVEAAATVRSEVDVADAGDQLHCCGRPRRLLLRVNPWRQLEKQAERLRAGDTREGHRQIVIKHDDVLEVWLDQGHPYIQVSVAVQVRV